MTESPGPRFGLSAGTLAEMRRILALQPEVERAVLFGSRAKGVHRPGSDIDLALMGSDLDLQTLSLLHRHFEESSIPYQVDLCLFSALDHPELRAHIERVGQLFYERG